MARSRLDVPFYKAAFLVLLAICMLAVSSVAFPVLCSLNNCDGLLGRHEVERAASPDGATDASIVENRGLRSVFGGPAIVGVYVVPEGQGVEDLAGEDKVLKAEDAEGQLRLRWRSDRLLEIGYGSATVEGFDNWHSIGEEQNNQYTIELRLNPPKDEPAG